MAAMFETGGKLSMLVLMICVIVQAFCPLRWSGADQMITVSAPYSPCHGSHPTPAQQHEKCCAASHAQQAQVATRYVAPKLINFPAKTDGPLTPAASSGEQFSSVPALHSALWRSSPVMRI